MRQSYWFPLRSPTSSAARSKLTLLLAGFLVLIILVSPESPAQSQPEGKRLPNTTVQATPAERTRLPVIFLPGVVGSQLYKNPPHWRSSEQLWPVSEFGNRPLLGLKSDSRSALGANIFVGDILRAGSAKFSSLADFYGSLIEFLKAKGYKEDTDLFTFPYDWRQDNKTHFEALEQKIRLAKQKSGKEKVILIGHSMGGLIMRAYVLSRADRAASVDTLITLATPYWGAPKVYYSMIKGYTFGNHLVRPQLMKILFQNWPAAYQLLPTASFIVDERKTWELCPPHVILPGIQCPKQLLTLPESYGVRYKWFKEVTPDPILDQYTETVDNVLTLTRELVELARDFHASAGTKENPKLPTNVKLYVIIGHGISTLSGYVLKDWEPGRWQSLFPSSYLELETGRKVTMEPHFDDGDGTVPLWGLEISGATATYYVPTSGDGDFYAGHGSLPKNKTAQEIVGQILDNNPPDAGRFPKTALPDWTLTSEESPNNLRLN